MYKNVLKTTLNDASVYICVYHIQGNAFCFYDKTSSRCFVIETENEMGGACSTHGGKERCIQDFDGET
jgi:hypothetical protein